MAKIDDIICTALDSAQKQGLRIVRGPCFIWGKENKLEAVDWCGAVLVYMNKAIKGFPKGWLREMCLYLGKDYYWFRSFNYGWSQLRPLEYYEEDEKTKKKKYFPDKDSLIGIKIGKKYVEK